MLLGKIRFVRLFAVLKIMFSVSWNSEGDKIKGEAFIISLLHKPKRGIRFFSLEWIPKTVCISNNKPAPRLSSLQKDYLSFWALQSANCFSWKIGLELKTRLETNFQFCWPNKWEFSVNDIKWFSEHWYFWKYIEPETCFFQIVLMCFFLFLHQLISWSSRNISSYSAVSILILYNIILFHRSYMFCQA